MRSFPTAGANWRTKLSGLIEDAKAILLTKPLVDVWSPIGRTSAPIISHPVHTVSPGRSTVTRGHIILGFSFEEGLVLQAIITCKTAHQRTLHPIAEDAADIFPRSACHCGKVALGDLLLNDDASLADIAA